MIFLALYARIIFVQDKIFSHLTDIPAEEIDAALRSPQLSMYLFQFADYLGDEDSPKQKEMVV